MESSAMEFTFKTESNDSSNDYDDYNNKCAANSDQIRVEAYTENLSAAQKEMRDQTRNTIWYSKEKSKKLLFCLGPPKSYKCLICQNSFTQRNSAYRHISTVHFKERPFQCAFCDKKYAQKPLLAEHIEGIHSDEAIFHCQFCTEYFTTKNQRKNHIRNEHPKGQFTCDVCFRKFTYQRSLLNHQTKEHGIVLDYSNRSSNEFNRTPSMDIH
ncbi:zinc finger protein 596-like protein [Leptotrombidium deliense]|uniref:Zinc finger protein 596-like protein n=1 Tax=Leptotrombidium deliense TaxID=299467 RepID=A0A443S446_9ACAR|nr:zinc finger protein 596-like protein [Leptotrombidium deliense]